MSHRSSFGESDLNPEKIEGYDARNAPFGKHAATGNEHLSALQEDYLRQLAAETGLGYQRLQVRESLESALKSQGFTRITELEADIRGGYAVIALMLLLLIFR